MNKIIILLIFCILTSCNQKIEESNITLISAASEKIKVLNFATFHMGITTDAKSVDFDEDEKKIKKTLRK